MKSDVKKKEKKYLFIELKKDILKIISDYCNEAGMKMDDIGFCQGYLNGKLDSDPIAMEQLLFLTQMYFYAGVYYSKTVKKFEYAYLNRKQRMEKTQEIKDKLGELIKQKQPKEIKPSYMG